MADVNREQFKDHVGYWWSHGNDRWLTVRTATPRGGATDGMTARDHVGPSSWEHGPHAYLSETDAQKWMETIGRSEADFTTREMGRRPDGHRSTRDAGEAAVVEGHDQRAIDDYFNGLEDDRPWDDED